MAVNLSKKGATIIHSLPTSIFRPGLISSQFYTLPGWVYPTIAPINNIINKKNAICAIPTTNTVDSLFFFIVIYFIKKGVERHTCLLIKNNSS